jgi:hypothetical protein
MIYVFLLMCFNRPSGWSAPQTPVPTLEVCHALIQATNKFGRDSDRRSQLLSELPLCFYPIKVTR